MKISYRKYEFKIQKQILKYLCLNNASGFTLSFHGSDKACTWNVHNAL